MNHTIIGTTPLDLTLGSTGNKTVKLSDYRGNYVVLYFYPKDKTPGCTQQAQAFRDHIDRLSQLNAVVVGVSRDSVRVHESFKATQQLPFDLLSDSDESLCRWFDVIKMKNMYGKQVQGIERSTFLLDPNGVIIHAWRKVKVTGHIEDVLQVLKANQ